jgi:hypothetical protein
VKAVLLMVQGALEMAVILVVVAAVVLVVALLAAKVPIIQIAFLLLLTAVTTSAKIPFHAGDVLPSKILNRGR